MKAWKETVRTYYKYVIAEYNPPNPDSSSGSDGYTFSNFVGGSNDSNSRACLNDTYSGNTFSSSSAWGSSGFTVRYPKKFVVKNAKYYAHIRSGAADPSIMYYFKIEGYNYDTSSYETIVDQGGNSADTWNEYTYTSNTLNTDLYKITFHGQKNNWGFASNLYLSGEAETAEESTSSDYDFYEDVDTYKILKQENVRKYYKYQYETFTRPNLTSDGVLGGGSFAVKTNGYVSGYQAYKAVDGNNSTGWECSNYATDAYIFYNPIPLKLTSIKMRNWTGSGRKDSSKGGKVYGSNNGEDWTELVTYTNSDYSSGAEWYISMTSVSSAYKYYKITCTDGTSDSGNYWTIAEMTPIGSEQTVVAGTSSDYDFYKDERVYQAFNIFGELTSGLVIDAIKEEGFNNAFGAVLENAEEYYIPLFYEGDIPTIVSIDPSSVQVSLPEHLTIDGIDFGFNFLLLMKDTTFSPETEMYFFVCIRDRETGDMDLYELSIVAVGGNYIVLRFDPYDLCNYQVTSVPFYFGEGIPRPVETVVRIKIPSNYEILSGQDYP